MKPLTLPRARRWSVALPLLAGGMALGNETWQSLGLPIWGSYDVRPLYIVSSIWLAHGVIFVLYTALAAWLVRGLPSRKLATLATLTWGVTFGAWFSSAATNFGMHVVHALPVVVFPGGPALEWPEQLRGMTGLAICIVAAGAATAGLLGWMTGSSYVAVRTVWVTLSAALMCYTAVLVSWAWQAPAVVWHIGVAAVLGRWLVGEARRRIHDFACPACGYSLAGLAPGAVCPECGFRPDVATSVPRKDGVQ